MIHTISDFLEQFRDYALKKIQTDEKDVRHRPTIGNIFEGLTRELLDKAVFRGLDLRIVENSFIYNDSGDLSDELDCLLVVGGGREISFTRQYKYHIKDVIAVIQVKKNLFGKDIDDSHQNLRSVIKVSEPRDAEAFVGKLHRDALRMLTSKLPPTPKRLERSTDREKLIYHMLLMEAFYPLRIVMGYYGYSTELALRDGFAEKLRQIAEKGPVHGYGPVSIPSLLICGDNAIIKTNGMPYAIPFTNNKFYWQLLTSTAGRPMLHLLELIWTRLSYKFEISSDIFGEDLEVEKTHPFISCMDRKIDEERWGWEYFYHYLGERQLSIPLENVPWMPVEIDFAQFSILTILQSGLTFNVEDDLNFGEFIRKEGFDKKTFIQELLDTGLVFLDEGELGLLTQNLMMVWGDDDKIFAGENNSGQMENYFKKRSVDLGTEQED
jgi:hypothetical protein